MLVNPTNSTYPKSAPDIHIKRCFPISRLAEGIIIDKNSKEHPQNEVKLKKYFTKKKECQGRRHLIYCQARPSSKICIVHNINPLENILF